MLERVRHMGQPLVWVEINDEKVENEAENYNLMIHFDYPNFFMKEEIEGRKPNIFSIKFSSDLQSPPEIKYKALNGAFFDQN